MKTLFKSWREMQEVGRWDLDYHLEPELIKAFGPKILIPIRDLAVVATEKRDPGNEPDLSFKYIDISSVDVSVGRILTPQDLTGDEAPSRARKVVRAYDVLVSTCRPTRGAVAIVPVALHNQIASTAFTVLRSKPGVNPIYLHFAVRLGSTREQFRKWGTGSSYPAILDEDVEKTLIPCPDIVRQDELAARIVEAMTERDAGIKRANAAMDSALAAVMMTMQHGKPSQAVTHEETEGESDLSISSGGISLDQIEKTLAGLPKLAFDAPVRRGRSSGVVESFLDAAIAS